MEHGGGSLERLGRVSIAWVKPPAPGLATAVRGCLTGAKP